MKTCATCRDGCFLARELDAFGPATQGTCATGGPDPSQGCSDVQADESCERWRAKA